MPMIQQMQSFDTNSFFSGGAGMFVQYHDVIKPAYLYAIIKMIAGGDNHGLPISTISKMSQLSIVEWYCNRRYRNPLKQLDYNHQIPIEELDELLRRLMAEDPSIYRIAPTLSTGKLFNVYRNQFMSFPVYVYEENIDKGMKDDVDSVLSGISHKLLSGNLRDALSKCDQNFTYIFSDIELAKNAVEILTGTCSNVLLASDYRYNKQSDLVSYKYDLHILATSHPFVRIGTTVMFDTDSISHLFDYLLQEGD